MSQDSIATKGPWDAKAIEKDAMSLARMKSFDRVLCGASSSMSCDLDAAEGGGRVARLRNPFRAAKRTSRKASALVYSFCHDIVFTIFLAAIIDSPDTVDRSTL